MKKLVFLLASIFLVGLSSVHAQDVLKFDSFIFHKGVVSIDHNQYDYFTFVLEMKGEDIVNVQSVSVNGVKAESQVFSWGVFKMYIVKVPKKAHAIVGKQFDVAINLMDGGLSRGSDLAITGDGGPGGGGDPTVIIIKYP